MNKLLYPVISAVFSFISILLAVFLLVVFAVYGFVTFDIGPVLRIEIIIISAIISIVLMALITVKTIKSNNNAPFFLIHSFIIALSAALMLIHYIFVFQEEAYYYAFDMSYVYTVLTPIFILVILINLLPIGLFLIIVKTYLSKGNQKLIKKAFFYQLISLFPVMFFVLTAIQVPACC